MDLRRREFVKSVAAGTGLWLAGGRRAWSAQTAAPNPGVKRVLVMFKCHFDAGFIDTQYNVVHGRYFEKFFPQAIEVARAANENGERRYVWTTGSWLLYEYLEQAAREDRAAMVEAIERGDIAWHALPFTWQTEMLPASMIEGSLGLARSLDKRYGKRSTGAKMTDVPGHTRGMIAPLAKNGVTFLEIGVNGGSTPAQLPPLFLWKDANGARLAMMYHHEYGGVAVAPGGELALVTEVRGDNSGPHTAEEIAAIHADLKAQFPNAEIRAASLSEMADALEPFHDRLPAVTDEIGDTWIHGCASDPFKVAGFRTIARLREQWIANGAMSVGDASDVALLRRVLLLAEHTWGTDTKTWLDFDNYLPADLAKMLDTQNYRVVEFSWIEKRQDLNEGVATLPEALREEALPALDGLMPASPVFSPQMITGGGGKLIRTEHFVLHIDARTGAITQLEDKATGREWASEKNPLALFTYQTLSQEDYQRFIASYLTTKADWAQKDFGKPNIERFGAKSQEWQAGSVEVSTKATEDAHRVVIHLGMSDDAAFAQGRAAFPRDVFLELAMPKAEPEIHLKLSWFGKPATRMPEALWLTFNPIAEDAKGWSLDKSGQQVSPFEIVANGNRHMHALQKGFAYESGGRRFAVDTLDAPVVALGARTPLLFTKDQPDLGRGIHSCLYNNAWGTNYIMWYGQDGMARYVIRPG